MAIAQHAKRRLRNIEAPKVDLVDRAANKRKFLVFKEEAMPGDNLGPELVAGEDGELHSTQASDIERAAAALETMTVSLEGLVAQLAKDSKTDVDKGGNAVAIFREVAERAMSAARSAMDGTGDMGKLVSEAKALATLLQGLGDKYPLPQASGDVQKAGKPANALRSVGMALLALAGQAQREGKITPAMASRLSGLSAQLGKLVGAKKSEAPVPLSEVITTETAEESAVVEAVSHFLHDAADQLTLLGKMAGEDDELNEDLLAEASALWTSFEVVIKRYPCETVKSARTFALSLQDAVGRAGALTQRANELGYKEELPLREVDTTQKLLEAIKAKYSDVEKATTVELNDLGQIIDADKMLNDFEAQLAKFMPPKPEENKVETKTTNSTETQAAVVAAPVVAPAAAPVIAPSAEVAKTETTEPPKIEPKVEPKIETAAIVEPPKVEPPKVDPNAELIAKIEAMGKQISELQTLVAKARDIVPAPASAGDPAPAATEDDSLLFPENYNSPAYREALAKRAGK